MFLKNQTVYLDDDGKEVWAKVIQIQGSKVLIEIPDYEYRGNPYQCLVSIDKLRLKARTNQWR